VDVVEPGASKEVMVEILVVALVVVETEAVDSDAVEDMDSVEAADVVNKVRVELSIGKNAAAVVVDPFELRPATAMKRITAPTTTRAFINANSRLILHHLHSCRVSY
jgi:hypothetical protein